MVPKSSFAIVLASNSHIVSISNLTFMNGFQGFLSEKLLQTAY